MRTTLGRNAPNFAAMTVRQERAKTRAQLALLSMAFAAGLLTLVAGHAATAWMTNHNAVRIAAER